MLVVVSPLIDVSSPAIWLLEKKKLLSEVAFLNLLMISDEQFISLLRQLLSELISMPEHM